MSILIKNMKMPKSCTECNFLKVRYSSLGAIGDCLFGCGSVVSPITASYVDKRYPNCPLMGLPEKHGRLIDADDVKSKMIPLSFSVQNWISEVELSKCKTVIETEGEE